MNRHSDLAALSDGTFDLLVVGGGITGAGVARDAAMRGLSVALVDAQDFAGGTSSNSSRLIHGGLRYLEHGWLRLVFEASRERRVLLRIAPHLVRPCPFTFPAFRGARVKRWQISAAVLLYDLLALFRNANRFRWLGRRAVLREEPNLRDAGLTGGAQYWDALTDDSRLTLATIRAAAAHGATCVNYVRVIALDKSAGRVRGAVCRDLESGADLLVRARVIVNATGPWSDSFRRLDEPDARPLLRLTKGAHIAVPRSRLGNRGAVTLTSPIDGRVMFVLPSGETSIVGTTDTDFDGSPGEVSVDADDVTYLLRSANAVFPAARLQYDDVIAAWAGLRPLLASPRASTADVPREHLISRSAGGVLSIVGGKLTTYRLMAAQVVDRVVADLHALDGRRTIGRSASDRVPLPGGEVRDLGTLVAEMVTEGLHETVARHLVHRYGAEAPAVARLLHEEPDLAMPICADCPDLRAEVVYQARREYARTVSDVLMRRTHLFHTRFDQALPAAADVASLLGGELGWDAARQASAVAEYTAQVERMRRALRPPAS
ncbi:MAG TPA: glycerol-3-phosphate dehydrogenase/oxidase [Gemmatimonadales bacterium]|nr:glycerol-3-phosphate dehydrogenase/oxidase [Gemmatimonadales bacterium]